MLALTLAAVSAAQPSAGPVDLALQVCRPEVAKRVDGEISAVEVDASSITRGWTVIRGSMRALIGMGEPAPGDVKAHHLIREDYTFICWVHDSSVRKISVNPVR